MGGKDWRRRLTGELETNPLLAATVFGAFGAVLGLSFAAMNDTPEKRREFKDRNTRYRRERAERRRQRELSSLRYRLQLSYFEQGPGKALFEDRAYIVLPAEQPFPDGNFERRPGRFGGPAFVAASDSAGMRLSAGYDPYDARGDFHLVRPDGSSRRSGAGFADDALVICAQDDDGIDAWIADAKLMARLIAAPGSFCHCIKLLRPDQAQIRDAIWQEYLQDNPHVAAAVGQG